MQSCRSALLSIALGQCVACCILIAKIMNNVLIDFDGTRVHAVLMRSNGGCMPDRSLRTACLLCRSLWHSGEWPRLFKCLMDTCMMYVKSHVVCESGE